MAEHVILDLQLLDLPTAYGLFVTDADLTSYVTLTGVQTLTNKTLTSPAINTPTLVGGTINNTPIGSTTPNTGAFTGINIGGTGASIVNIANILGVNPLEIHTANALGIALYAHAEANFRGANIQFYRSHGVQATPTAVQNTDTMGYFSYGGWDGSVYYESVQVQGVATENWSSTNRGSLLQFLTTANGAAVSSVKLTIAGDGTITATGGASFGGINATPIGGTTPAAVTATTLTVNTGALFPYGDAATPGIRFSSDPDTGIYGNVNATANSIGFSTSGAVKMHINSSGIRAYGVSFQTDQGVFEGVGAVNAILRSGSVDIVRLQNSSQVNLLTLTTTLSTFLTPITVMSDTDATTILGRARIDSRATDIAYFSHFDMTTTAQHALRQNASGATWLNAASGQALSFTVANVNVISLTSSLIAAIQPFTTTITDAGTTTVANATTDAHSSSGVPAAGFGVGHLFQGHSSTNTTRDMARIRSVWTTATDASRVANMVLSVWNIGVETDILALTPTTASLRSAVATRTLNVATGVANQQLNIDDTGLYFTRTVDGGENAQINRDATTTSNTVALRYLAGAHYFYVGANNVAAIGGAIITSTHASGVVSVDEVANLTQLTSPSNAGLLLTTDQAAATANGIVFNRTNRATQATDRYITTWTWNSVEVAHLANNGEFVTRGESALTNTVLNVLTVGHNTSGTPAASYGTGLAFQGESSTTVNRDMARIRSIWTTATDASRVSDLILSVFDVGVERDVVTVKSTGVTVLTNVVQTLSGLSVSANVGSAIVAAMQVQNTSAGGFGYTNVFEALAPNSITSNNIYFAFGRNAATNNRVGFNLLYAGDGSTSNIFSIGFYGGNDLLKMFASGDVVFNDAGANADFRIEGDTNADLFFVDASADFIGLKTNAPTATLDINADTIRLRTAKTPASAAAAGNQGDIAWDSGFIYICTATNTWKRVAIATW